MPAPFFGLPLSPSLYIHGCGHPQVVLPHPSARPSPGCPSWDSFRQQAQWPGRSMGMGVSCTQSGLLLLFLFFC